MSIVQAIRNNGSWPTILEFLDDTGLSIIPLFGSPPVVRDLDGTLRIYETGEEIPVGDWLTLDSGGKIHGVTDDDFQNIRWDTR